MMPIIYFAVIAAILFIALRYSCGDCVMGRAPGTATQLMPLVSIGWALSLFLMITYLVCIGFDLLFPQYAMYRAWADLLPGFEWLTPTGFVIGLIETFLYGWYVALVFVPLHNAFASRTAR